MAPAAITSPIPRIGFQDRLRRPVRKQFGNIRHNMLPGRNGYGTLSAERGPWVVPCLSQHRERCTSRATASWKGVCREQQEEQERVGTAGATAPHERWT